MPDHGRRRKPAGSLVIGVGNEFRGDDGAGIIAAGEMERLQLPGVRIVRSRGEASGLISLWEGQDLVYVIDAVSSKAPPGTVLRLVATEVEIPDELFAYSSHAFGVAQALGLSRALNRLPRELVIYGIEGASFEPATEVSPAVREGITDVVQRLMGELQAANGG